MAIKPNKEKVIGDIVLELEQGAERGKVLAKFGKKWQISDRTFDRYWKTANSRYLERQQVIQKQLEIDSVQAAQDRLKKAILTKEERMEIASKIAKGEAWKVGSTVIAPTAGDRIKAMDYLSKIDGDYATVKQDITTKGESLNDTTLEKQRFDELLKAAREGIGKN